MPRTGSLWTDAELRSRITLLGLTVQQLAEIHDWDLRTLRRQAGGTTVVSRRTEETVRMLEREAREVLSQMDEATEQGIPIRIPHWTSPGVRPGTWWHALAGRHIARWGDDAQIVYDDEGDEDGEA